MIQCYCLVLSYRCRTDRTLVSFRVEETTRKSQHIWNDGKIEIEGNHCHRVNDNKAIENSCAHISIASWRWKNRKLQKKVEYCKLGSFNFNLFIDRNENGDIVAARRKRPRENFPQLKSLVDCEVVSYAYYCSPINWLIISQLWHQPTADTRASLIFRALYFSLSSTNCLIDECKADAWMSMLFFNDETQLDLHEGERDDYRRSHFQRIRNSLAKEIEIWSRFTSIRLVSLSYICDFETFSTSQLLAVCDKMDSVPH